MMDIKIQQKIREAFELNSCPNFGHDLEFTRNSRGEYVNPALEDHWQTFQEGWEAAIDYIKTLKPDNKYTAGPISTGGMDPRNQL